MTLTTPQQSSREYLRLQEQTHAKLKRELRQQGYRYRKPRNSQAYEQGAAVSRAVEPQGARGQG